MPGKKKPTRRKNHLDTLCDKRRQHAIELKILDVTRDEDRKDRTLRKLAKEVEKLLRRATSKAKKSGLTDERIARLALDIATMALLAVPGIGE